MTQYSHVYTDWVGETSLIRIFHRMVSELTGPMARADTTCIAILTHIGLIRHRVILVTLGVTAAHPPYIYRILRHPRGQLYPLGRTGHKKGGLKLSHGP